VDGGEKAPGPKFYKAFVRAPWSNEYVLETARAAVQAEQLGQDSIPDLLAINLSTNDYIGHEYGPDSPEVMDCTVQTDRQLADFFRFLQRTVPGGFAQVTLALTADHGVAPVPEEMQARGFHAGRILDADLETTADAALDARLGAGDWVLKYVEPYLYLNENTMAAASLDPEVAQKIAARAVAALDGVYYAYPRVQIEEGRLGDTDLASHLMKGFYPKLAGDVLVVTEALWFTEESPHKYTTTHGSPYAYDTKVPLLLAGFGLRPGVYWETVCPADLAPTLCSLLGIDLPSACDGVPLVSALQGHDPTKR
jgi:predicted AlkP superfamily pyrophosphatase or phosphodiesterase